MSETTDQLTELRKQRDEYKRLYEAVQLVLNDFRNRRAVTQAQWDKQEADLIGQSAFYEGWMVYVQGQVNEFEQKESDETKTQFDFLDRQAKQLHRFPGSTESTKRGAITESIEGSLRFSALPQTILQLADMLVSKGLKADRTEASEAVRSALKNLKKQGKVAVRKRGEYVHSDTLKKKVATA